jgi:hypothetical protein
LTPWLRRNHSLDLIAVDEGWPARFRSEQRAAAFGTMAIFQLILIVKDLRRPDG